MAGDLGLAGTLTERSAETERVFSCGKLQLIRTRTLEKPVFIWLICLRYIFSVLGLHDSHQNDTLYFVF